MVFEMLEPSASVGSELSGADKSDWCADPSFSSTIISPADASAKLNLTVEYPRAQNTLLANGNLPIGAIKDLCSIRYLNGRQIGACHSKPALCLLMLFCATYLYGRRGAEGPRKG
mmetsp:Transcript_21968/g.46356  ORF Transcript_21968/g.46356 Transcript_21968/m.46356 type:complete len:115 (-) Transcript_21968:63-407(-)